MTRISRKTVMMMMILQMAFLVQPTTAAAVTNAVSHHRRRRHHYAPWFSSSSISTSTSTISDPPQVALLATRGGTAVSSRRRRASTSKGTTTTKSNKGNKGNNRKVTHDHDNAPTALRLGSTGWWWYHIRVGTAGGLAGAVGTCLLYPIDAAKTLRQGDPHMFASVWAALVSPQARWFRGIVPAALGSVPSSALYFGAYESMKSVLLHVYASRSSRSRSQPPASTTKHKTPQPQRQSSSSSFWSRLFLHAAAAASGNVLSSAVFVPKEFIKQQLQYGASTSLRHCLAQHGVAGLYRGYRAVLFRNIPSAALRFCLYEELKYLLYTSQQHNDTTNKTNPGTWRLFVAGAAAGAVASGLLTPMDVVKTRMSVGTCPIVDGVSGCLHYVLDSDGWTALYAGAGSRMFFSGLFSAAGFGTFETVKRWMGVASRRTATTQ